MRNLCDRREHYRGVHMAPICTHGFQYVTEYQESDGKSTSRYGGKRLVMPAERGGDPADCLTAEEYLSRVVFK